MSDYFKTYLSIALAEFEQTCRVKLSQEEARAANEGRLLAGRRWIDIEEIIVETFSGYSNDICQKLRNADFEHSAIKNSSFEDARLSVSAFKTICQGIHQERRNKYSDIYPKNREPFDGSSFERAYSLAINEINGVQREYKSKRSFIKWALGDLRKRVWTATTMFTGGLIGAYGPEALKLLLSSFNS